MSRAWITGWVSGERPRVLGTTEAGHRGVTPTPVAIESSIGGGTVSIDLERLDGAVKLPDWDWYIVLEAARAYGSEAAGTRPNLEALAFMNDGIVPADEPERFQAWVHRFGGTWDGNYLVNSWQIIIAPDATQLGDTLKRAADDALVKLPVLDPNAAELERIRRITRELGGWPGTDDEVAEYLRRRVSELAVGEYGAFRGLAGFLRLGACWIA